MFVSLVLVSQGKLVKYFSRQLSYKHKVPLQERNVELDGFPRLTHWLRIVNMRKEVTEVLTLRHAHFHERALLCYV